MASPPEKRRSEGEEKSRAWSGLPAPALFSIAMSLTGSLADVLNFGRVCRAWRSVARDNERDLMSSLPPFLFLRRNIALYCPTDGRMYKNRRLTELVGEEVNVGTLRCSFGHLFVSHNRRRDFSVVNPLALTRTHAGIFPPELYVPWAVLSSPPASPDCVLWYFDKCAANIRRLRLRDQQYCTKLSSERREIDAPVFFHGKAYLLDYEAEFVNGPFVSSPEVTILPSVGGPLLEYLCVSGAELLLVTVDRTEEYQVHRFDFSSSVAAGGWVRVPSLGGRLLLRDDLGVTVLENPGRWGGRGDCIYFARTTGVSVVHGVFDLKDGTRTEYCHPLQINPSPDTMLSLWTSSTHPFYHSGALWILPSMCY